MTYQPRHLAQAEPDGVMAWWDDPTPPPSPPIRFMPRRVHLQGWNTPPPRHARRRLSPAWATVVGVFTTMAVSTFVLTLALTITVAEAAT